MDITDIKEPLSPEELKALRLLLNSIDKGDTSLVRDLYELDYDYAPVDVETFLRDKYFLGISTEGGNRIYSYWHDVLQEIFDNEEKHEIILTGPIGTGKSTVATVGLAYVLHQLLCLKEPQRVFGLMGGSSIVMLFFSLSVSLMDVGAYHLLNDMLLKSPFFAERGERLGTKNVVYKPEKGIIMQTGSAFTAGYGAVGLNVVGGMLDEFNEVPASTDAVREKAKIFKVYSAVSNRMASRFMQLGYMFGKLFLVSSTKDEDALLTNYIEQAREKKTVLVYNDPVWVIKPHKFFVNKTFTVAVGDQYKESRIIPDDKATDYELDGYKILRVPYDLKAIFEDDIGEALQDFAGIGTKTGRIAKLFPNVIGLKHSVRQQPGHPFTADVIPIGVNTGEHLYDFFDLSMLRDIDAPHYIHTDIGITGDALGLGMAHPVDVVETSAGEQQVKIYVDFLLKVVPQYRDEVFIRSVREFIVWLRAQGVTIEKVTADGYQSRDMIQILHTQMINAELLSVDYTTPKQPDAAYLSLKSALFDNLISLYYYAPLWRELKDLLHDKAKSKVDHPKHGSDGFRGSKDTADALAGVVYKMRTDFAEGGLVLMNTHNQLKSNVTYVSLYATKHATKLTDLDMRLLGIGKRRAAHV